MASGGRKLQIEKARLLLDELLTSAVTRYALSRKTKCRVPGTCTALYQSETLIANILTSIQTCRKRKIKVSCRSHVDIMHARSLAYLEMADGYWLYR